jgi:serine/threonine protein kinase
MRDLPELVINAGTFPYQAPEKTLSFAADIYALGISMLEFMTLNKWKNGNRTEIEMVLETLV